MMATHVNHPLRGSLWLATLMAAVTTSQALHADVVLVKDGQAKGVIVVQRDNDKSRLAGLAIQEYVQKISGAQLPLVTEGDALPADAQGVVLVGHTQRAEALKVAIPKGFNEAVHPEAFEEEGYVLKTIGKELIVAGNNDGPYRGTNYAAWALLERLGCRWYFPGPWGEVVPKASDIVVPKLDVTSKPDFAVRKIWLSGWIPTSTQERELYNAWAEKIGWNMTQEYPLVGDGFLAYLVPPKEFAESNPEYYALTQDGKRAIAKLRNGAFYENNTMLCLSNPDVYDVSVKHVRDALEGKTKSRIVTSNGFGISPPDGTPYCYCEQCAKTSQQFAYPTYVHKRMASEEFFGFAAKLAREFPDKFVATMAYALREMPPQGVDLPRNISVLYAPISCDVLHPNDSKLWRRAEYMKILRQWTTLSDHVMLYDYNPGMLTGFFLPERDVENMAINARMYRELGVKGMAREGRKAFMQTWLSYYMTGKLLWDADADVNAIKDEFYGTFFGPSAGPAIRAWFDACAHRLADNDFQAHEDFLINHIYTLDFVRSIRKHIDTAAAATMTDEQRARFQAVLHIADHLEAYAQMMQAEADMNWTAAAGYATTMVDLKNKLHAIDSFLIEVDKGRARPYFAEGRAVTYKTLADRSGGEAGDLVANLPREMRYIRDPFNEGVVGEWYLDGHDDSRWETRDSYLLWEQQEPNLSPSGHDYDGYGWYRTTFDVPANMTGRQVQLYLGGIFNAGWVWINGRYIGHKTHDLWWSHNNQYEADVTAAIKPGQKNTLTVRVWNDGEFGGLHRRGFLWAPKPQPEKAP